MPSAPHASEWYRPDPVATAPEDLVLLMELAGVKFLIRPTGGNYIVFEGNQYFVPCDEDGTWQRNAYEIWQYVTTKGKYGR